MTDIDDIRFRVRETLTKEFGDDFARDLMSLTPPFNWTDVAMKSDVAGAKSDVRDEIAHLRSEMRSEFKAVRSEMASEFAAVRAEMRSEFKAVRSEMASEFKAVRAEMAALEDRINGRFAVSEARMDSSLHSAMRSQTIALSAIFGGLMAVMTTSLSLVAFYVR
jgi:hypothetical protein